jgi:hypothetical protein
MVSDGLLSEEVLAKFDPAFIIVTELKVDCDTMSIHQALNTLVVGSVTVWGWRFTVSAA